VDVQSAARRWAETWSRALPNEVQAQRRTAPLPRLGSERHYRKIVRV